MGIKSKLGRAFRYIFKGVPVKKVYARIDQVAPSSLLKGRTALVTGGSSGIGLEIAKSFMRAGANVIITGRNEEKLLNAVEQLIGCTNGENIIKSLVWNHSDVGIIDERFIEVRKLVGGNSIDILVNNAGLVGGEIRNCDITTYDRIFSTNIRGVFFLTKRFSEYLKENGIRGNILNIGSSSSLRPATSAYALTKWSVLGLTKGMAKILSPYGITVNGIAPGPTATPMLMKDGVKEDICLEKSPIGRYVLPEEIANMALFLVSDMGRSIVGDMIYMTGGAGVITYDDINQHF